MVKQSIRDTYKDFIAEAYI